MTLVVLAYSLLIVCIYVGLGLGLTILFCPKTLRKYIPLLAPLIGYCYLTLAGWYCYKLNVVTLEIYSLLILALPLLLLLFILVKNKYKSLDYLKSLLEDKDLLTACVISLLGFVVISFPLFLNAQGLTSIVMGNNDAANYTLISNYLKEFSHSGVSGFFAQQEPILKKHIEKSVFGAFLSTSFAASLLSLEVYQIQSITIHIFFAFGIAIVYAIARQLFQYNYWGASGVTILYALNPLIYFTIYEGFQAQIIAMSLLLCLFLLNIQAVMSCKKNSDWYRYLPLSVLLNWGMSLTYPHMLPLLYAPILTYVAWYSFQTKSRNLFIRYSLFIIVSLIIMSMLSVDRFIALINYFLHMERVDAGFHIPFIFPAQIFSGLIIKNQVVNVLFSLFVIFLVALGFNKAYKSEKKLVILVVSSMVIVLIGYMILSVKNWIIKGELGGYKSFKLLSFFIPQILLACLIFFKKVQLNSKLKVKAIVLALIIVFETYHTLGSAEIFMRSHGSVTPEMVALKKIEADSSIKSINILGKDIWKIMWTANFLARKKLYFETRTYYPASTLEGDWDLIIVDPTKLVEVAHKNPILKVIGFNSESNLTTINSSYKIQKAPLLRASFGKGWYDREEKHVWNGNDSNSSSIIIHSLSKGNVIDVHATYLPLNYKNKISIFFNSKKVLDCASNEYCDAKKLVLSKGNNSLQFKAAIPPQLPGNRDTRLLSYAFSSIEITPSSQKAAR